MNCETWVPCSMAASQAISSCRIRCGSQELRPVDIIRVLRSFAKCNAQWPRERVSSEDFEKTLYIDIYPICPQLLFLVVH